ncbi:hypothetical protein DFH09DRAFT_1028589 [Mycena vulgaris]|nr:hypothetical protein DFH09DRAFT_1028589 [Mycena vulgaris]
MSSPFTSKLGTNYCPQDAEIAEIKALIVEPGLRLKCLDDEITDLQQALDKLKEEHSRLGTYIEGHMALISPARRLPLDIVQEIFLACIPTHRNCVMSATEAPVLLGLICSSWRTISLSTPRLWSSLHIAVPSHQGSFGLTLYEEKLSQRLATTKTWLARSGSCALSISLQGPYYAVGASTSTQILLLQALLPLSSRWEHIEFTAPHSVLAALSHLTEADVPTLKSFTINEIFDGQENSSQADSFPVLRGLDISSISLSGIAFSPLELPLRWDNLVDLSIKAGWGKLGDPLITSEVALQLLSQCRALQTCQLQVNDLPDTGGGMEHIIECASLHTLEVMVIGDLAATVRKLLPRLSLSALRHLKLYGHSNDDDNISYTPCFFAAAPCLETLDLNLGLFSRSSLIDFLRGPSPTIHKLHITETSGYHSSILDDDALAALIPSPSVPAPWFFNLQELGIHGCRGFSDQALLHFIQSGMSAPALGLLKRLAIQFSREMHLDILPDLRHIIDAGLHIELTYPPPLLRNFSPWVGLADDPGLPAVRTMANQSVASTTPNLDQSTTTTGKPGQSTTPTPTPTKPNGARLRYTLPTSITYAYLLFLLIYILPSSTARALLQCFRGAPMSSPFTSKLGTNYCPQDAEIAEIKALIVEPGLRLKCLDDEITDLQQALAKLKEEHSRLGTYIEGHMALISPARRLPLDIIQEIFLACIPTHRNCVMSATEAPVLLGRICSSWRTISLSTPRLWSTLHIALSPYNNNMSLVLYEEKLLQRLATTKTWLARSGECGLSISLQGPYYAVGLSEATQVLLQALLPLSSRWEHIEFTAVHSVLAALSHLTEADVPTLKSFTVNEIHDGQGHAIQPDSFPLLRGLAISSISLSEIALSPLELPLRWDNLVNLSIMAGWGQLGDPLITSEVALQLLSRCPALQTCQLQVNDLPDTGSGMKHIIECASLHALDLQIGGDLATTMRELLPRLSFPALRHLKLCGPSSDGDGISYTPCFFATAPCLERLTINLLPFSKSSLIDFLRGLSPTIRTLRIEETYGFNRSSILDDDVLAALIPAPSSPAPWFSNLQELGIHGCGAFSDQALLHLIQSGMTAPALGALKRLAIQFNREMQLDILPDLQHVINGGLHIELAYSAPPVYNFHFSPWWGLPDDLSLPMGMDGWPGH